MELLDKNQYEHLTTPLEQVKINTLFARAVIEKKVSGLIYVDQTGNPKTFYVVHPYGMSLLFGDSTNSNFNDKFLHYSLNTHQIRDKFEWMQTYPDDWNKVLSDLYGTRLIKVADNKEHIESGIIELNTRVNFKFNQQKYYEKKPLILPQNCKIVQTDMELYDEMKGSVIPTFFWNSAHDFIQNGIGFSLISNNSLAATAYSAFIHNSKLEIGIETVDKFRNQGFAQLACSALIDYCLRNNYEPVWACRLENTGSFKLAEKLGFEVYSKLPYYRLSK
jgi:hypothetical protein